MISVSDFRKRIADRDYEYLRDEVLLSEGALHVPDDNIEHIRQSLSMNYRVEAQDISVVITGSAKIGFSIVEKRLPNITLPRFRSFSPRSDIDVAIVSRQLFELIWESICRWAHGKVRFPWNSESLGDYLVYGWLRPDLFPRDARIRNCDDWWRLFNDYSTNPKFNRRAVRGGLFYSRTQLALYTSRAIRECARAEELES